MSNFVILFHEKIINDGKTSPSSLIEFYLIDEFFSLPLCGYRWLLNDDWLLPKERIGLVHQVIGESVIAIFCFLIPSCAMASFFRMGE